MTFDATHVVSLGGNCRITHNLRRHFNFQSAYPFDWWRTPLASATAFLAAPDLDVLYDPTRLEPIFNEGVLYSVRNVPFGIRLHHDFPRARGAVAANFRDLLHGARERTAYLVDKLFHLNSAANRILFARKFIDEDAKTSGQDLLEFVRTVQRRFSLASVHIVLINPPVDMEIPGVVTIRFPDPPGKHWKGDFATWTKQLSQLDVAFSNAGGGKFTGMGPEQEQRKLHREIRTADGERP